MSAAIYNLLMNIISLYIFIILVWVIMSWLISFGIVNTRNAFARNVVATLDALVEPAVRPIRKILPAFGGLDLSPIVLLLGLNFIRILIDSYYRTGSLV